MFIDFSDMHSPAKNGLQVTINNVESTVLTQWVMSECYRDGHIAVELLGLEFTKTVLQMV